MSKTSLSKPGALRIILLTWLTAGTLDILAACTQFYLKRGTNPFPVILKYIASGVFGQDAFKGGADMMAWGLLFHYLIALGCVLAFFFLYPNIKLMRLNKWITAIVYGFLAWVVTTRIIIPASYVKPAPFNLTNALIAMAILMCMIGLPCVFMIGRYFDRQHLQRE